MLGADANQGRFIVLNDSTDAELERLHDPLRFQDWMLFLHPGQQRVVEENFAGPALLTGVSGSGKTCVLVHRARELATRYSNGSILVVTLNRSLARLIQNLVKRLCLDGEESRIDVLSFHDYLTDVLTGEDLRQFSGMVRRIFGIRKGGKSIPRSHSRAGLADFLSRAVRNGTDPRIRGFPSGTRQPSPCRI